MDVEEIKGFNLFDDPNIPSNVMSSLISGEVTRCEFEFNYDLVKKKSLYSTKKVGVSYLDVLISPLATEKNVHKGYLVHVQDITKRKQLEREMTKLDRLNLVGELAAGIGHEVRNPITAVRGFLQLLSSKDDCLRYKEYFDTMINELNRADSIIIDFLSLAKGKESEFKLQNLNLIIKNLYPLIEAHVMVSEKYISLELSDVPELSLDEKDIRQLILNLVRNGMEAMSPGGKMHIKTFTDGEEVVLAVQDNGKGIERELLEKIGTPFFTTKERGTGLGLAVSYRIADKHNATINIETGSTGTTFFIKFKLES